MKKSKNLKKQPELISYENAQKVADIFNQNVSRDYKNANLRLTPSKDGIYTISYLYADATHFRESNSMEIDPNKSIVGNYQDAGAAGRLQIINVENLEGGAGNDILIGNVSNNELKGGLGRLS